MTDALIEIPAPAEWPKIFTEKQIAFLNARQQADTDVDALAEAGVSASGLHKWLSKNQKFKAVRDAIIESQRKEVPLDLGEDYRKRLSLAAYDQLAEALPKAISNLIAIATGERGSKDSDAVAAMKVIKDIVGLSPENMNPLDKHSKQTVAVLGLMMSQFAASAKQRDMQLSAEMQHFVNNTVDGQFKVLPEGK
jgi:hypothetical protein